MKEYKKEEKDYTKKYERWEAREKRYLEGAETPLNRPTPKTLRDRLREKLIEAINRAGRYRLLSDGVTPINPHQIGRGLADLWSRQGKE